VGEFCTHTQSVVLMALCLMHKSQVIILASSYRCIHRTVSHHEHKVVFYRCIHRTVSHRHKVVF